MVKCLVCSLIDAPEDLTKKGTVVIDKEYFQAHFFISAAGIIQGVHLELRKTDCLL